MQGQRWCAQSPRALWKALLQGVLRQTSTPCAGCTSTESRHCKWLAALHHIPTCAQGPRCNQCDFSHSPTTTTTTWKQFCLCCCCSTHLNSTAPKGSQRKSCSRVRPALFLHRTDPHISGVQRGWLINLNASQSWQQRTTSEGDGARCPFTLHNVNSAPFLRCGEGCKGFLLSALPSHTKRELHSSELKPATFPAAGTLSRDQLTHKLGQKPWKKQGESLQMRFQRNTKGTDAHQPETTTPAGNGNEHAASQRQAWLRFAPISGRQTSLGTDVRWWTGQSFNWHFQTPTGFRVWHEQSPPCPRSLSPIPTHRCGEHTKPWGAVQALGRKVLSGYICVNAAFCSWNQSSFQLPCEVRASLGLCCTHLWKKPAPNLPSSSFLSQPRLWLTTDRLPLGECAASSLLSPHLTCSRWAPCPGQHWAPARPAFTQPRAREWCCHSISSTRSLYSCSLPVLLQKDLLNAMYFKRPFLELASPPPSPLPLMTTLDCGFYALPTARWQRREHWTQGCQRNLKHAFLTAEKDQVLEQLRSETRTRI